MAHRIVETYTFRSCLKGLFHQAFPAHVVSLLVFVCRNFHGPRKWRLQRQTKRRHVQGMHYSVPNIQTQIVPWTKITTILRYRIPAAYSHKLVVYNKNMNMTSMPLKIGNTAKRHKSAKISIKITRMRLIT